MVGHDHIARERKPVTVADFTQNLHKQILGARRGQQGQPPVTAARNEVEVAQSVPATQAFRHGQLNQKPRPRNASRAAHPNFRILTRSGRIAVVSESGEETTLWNTKARATRHVQRTTSQISHSRLFSVPGLKAALNYWNSKARLKRFSIAATIEDLRRRSVMRSTKQGTTRVTCGI